MVTPCENKTVDKIRKRCVDRKDPVDGDKGVFNLPITNGEPSSVKFFLTSVDANSVDALLYILNKVHTAISSL